MSSLKYAALFVAFAFVLSVGAFAKDSNSGNFDLQQPAQVGSTLLQPGHYKAEWTGSSNAVKVDILQHGKTVATAQGKIKQLPAKSPYDSVDLKNANNNTKRVNEIDFNNRSEALVLSGM